MWVAHSITRLFSLIYKYTKYLRRDDIYIACWDMVKVRKTWQWFAFNVPGQTKRTYVNKYPTVSQRAPNLVLLFFISCLLLSPPYLLGTLCWVCCTLQPSWKHNMCFFWWRLHKSESFISHQHTSAKTARWIRLFLSHHFPSIFWCQDPSWLTSAGSIWVPYRPGFQSFALTPDW